MNGRLVFLLVLAACARPGPPAAPAVEVLSGPVAAGPAVPAVTAPIATPGEQMVYRVAIHGLEVGEYAINVGEVTRIDGIETVAVQSSVRTSKVAALLRTVQDDFASWIDRKSGRSVLFTSRELAHPKDAVEERTEARFEGEHVDVLLVRPEGTWSEAQVTHGPGYDIISFLILLRGWEAEPGTRREADVMRSRYVWRAMTVVVGYENLATSMGDLAAVRFDGESVRTRRDGTLDPASERRRWSIWITDDADRVPVKIVAHTDYGALQMELIAYRAGATTAR